MAFFRGQKVVCIYDHSRDLKASRWPFPKQGEIVTIASIEDEIIPGETYFVLEEFFSSGYYWSGSFRPLCERKTDISALQQLLVTKQADLETV